MGYVVTIPLYGYGNGCEYKIDLHYILYVNVYKCMLLAIQCTYYIVP